jgi:hypothetical protein
VGDGSAGAVLKCDGADACRKVVRYQVEHGVDWIKV